MSYAVYFNEYTITTIPQQKYTIKIYNKTQQIHNKNQQIAIYVSFFFFLHKEPLLISHQRLIKLIQSEF